MTTWSLRLPLAPDVVRMARSGQDADPRWILAHLRARQQRDPGRRRRSVLERADHTVVDPRGDAGQCKKLRIDQRHVGEEAPPVPGIFALNGTDRLVRTLNDAVEHVNGTVDVMFDRMTDEAIEQLGWDSR
jgi:hypothetical protein